MWVLHNGISVPIRRDIRACSVCPVKTQRKGDHLQVRKKVLTRILDTGTLISDYQIPKVKKLSVKPPRRWHFIMAAQVDEENCLNFVLFNLEENNNYAINC